MVGLFKLKPTVKNPFCFSVIQAHSESSFTEQLLFTGHSHGNMLKSLWPDKLALNSYSG